MLRQLAPHAGRQLRIGDRSDGHAPQLRHRMAHRLEHLADLLRAAFAQLHFPPTVPLVGGLAGRLDRGDVARERPLPVEGDAAAQLVDDALLGDAAHLHVVRLHRAVLRMRHLVRELAVVREEHQPFAVVVEAPDRVDPFAHAAHEVDHRAAALRVLHRRHHLFRLVDDDVAVLFGAGDQLAVDFDVVAIGIGPRPELGDDAAVQRDSPRPHHRFRLAS